jgi:hypothetical protein
MPDVLGPEVAFAVGTLVVDGGTALVDLPERSEGATGG